MIWLWQNGYPFYVNRVAPVVFSPRGRALAAAGQRGRLRPPPRGHGPRHVLAEPTRLETPVPVAFPEKSRAVLVSPHESYVFPEIFVTTVRNAAIYGSTNFVCVGGEVIHHNLTSSGTTPPKNFTGGRPSIQSAGVSAGCCVMRNRCRCCAGLMPCLTSARALVRSSVPRPA